MKFIQLPFIALMLLCISPFQVLPGKSILVDKPNGATFELHIDENDRFLDVIELLKCYLQSSKPEDKEDDIDKAFFKELYSPVCQGELSLVVTQAGIFAKAKKDRMRDYDAAITKEERNNIAFIVKTLGFDSVIGIGKEKSSLESAGKKIEHLHPFCFLKAVFRDEELKAGMAAIRDRISWIKNGFFDGIYGSLKDEAQQGNLDPHIEDFSKKLKIDPITVRAYIEKKKWKDMVDYLIDTIPREKDPKRYNM